MTHTHLNVDNGCLPSPFGTCPENPGDCDALNLSSVDARRARQPSRKFASGPVPISIFQYNQVVFCHTTSTRRTGCADDFLWRVVIDLPRVTATHAAAPQQRQQCTDASNQNLPETQFTVLYLPEQVGSVLIDACCNFLGITLNPAATNKQMRGKVVVSHACLACLIIGACF